MITDLNELGALLDACRRTLFRLKTLDVYEVASDGSDYRRYLDGEPEPEWERKQLWLDKLNAERDSGYYRYRVHVLRTPLGPYLRYECEWGYAYNVQGLQRAGGRGHPHPRPHRHPRAAQSGRSRLLAGR